MKLENFTNNRLILLLDFIIEAQNKNRNTDFSIEYIKQTYGYIFTILIRSFVEQIYRLGSKNALNFEGIQLPDFTTHKDIDIINQWTEDSLGKFYFRLNDAINKNNNLIDFYKVLKIVLVQISTFVYIESIKEKTEQLLDFFEFDKIDIAQGSKTLKTYQGLPRDARGIKLLMALKGIDGSKGNNTINKKTFLEFQDGYFFTWVTARDDRVCRRYCAPLDGIMWQYNEIKKIPRPHTLTHPNCRCMVMKFGF